ncbi:MAG: phage holin family protein [Abitibacteriaceae bacterium]|nr:phage holin family protein [Abditibacteriaceae bacterium]MBV9864465.1 phage holin family protein [Abditibacteriaceae bacterium]
MMSFIIRTVINAVALLVIANVSGGQIQVKDFGSAIIAAIVLGLANAVVKPILYFIAKSLTCALSCITLGLWSLVLSWLINGLLFYAVGQLVNGFVVKSFGAALWGALALSVVNALATVLTRQDEDKKE